MAQPPVATVIQHQGDYWLNVERKRWDPELLHSSPLRSKTKRGALAEATRLVRPRYQPAADQIGRWQDHGPGRRRTFWRVRAW